MFGQCWLLFRCVLWEMMVIEFLVGYDGFDIDGCCKFELFYGVVMIWD